jgi:uncharacterized iron-regulated membrane protein
METSPSTFAHPHATSAWQRWLHHPESAALHRVLFNVHMLVGTVASAYLFCMSLSGSVIVFRNELEVSANPNSHLFRVVEWLVRFHGELLLGDTGRRLNGIGGTCLTLLGLTGIIIWWPGITHWRRSLTVNWRSSFARINWDFHNVLGFWCLLFVMMWGISGIYFCFPQVFDSLVNILEPGPPDKLRYSDQVLTWLSNLHFGRFNVWTEALWALLGLVPAVLAFTGVFMCCHRLLIRKGAPLPK